MPSSKAARSPNPAEYSVGTLRGDGRLRTPLEDIFSSLDAEVAELADALDSGSSARKGVRVQIPASAPHQFNSPTVARLPNVVTPALVR